MEPQTIQTKPAQSGMTKVIVVGIIALIVGIAIGYGAASSMKNDKMMQPAKENAAMKNNDTEMAKGVMVGGALMTPDKDIVDNAVGSKDHTTLVAAVKAASLVETLKGKGPFTVFAPTNEAFTNLPDGTVDTLLMPENKAKLTSILTYHVVPGALRIADLTDGQELKTVEGDTLKVTKTGNTTFINGVSIQIPDVISSNGVTHVIGSVLLPPANGAMSNGVMVGGALMTSDKDIVDNALAAKNVTTVVAAVKAADLVATLKGPGPFTVFAPTNAAFDKLPAGTVDTLLKPENKAKLAGILTYHVVAGALRIADLTDGQTLKTVNGQTLTVHVKDGVVSINNAVIQTPDVISSNGVTHVIDTVLLPQ